MKTVIINQIHFVNFKGFSDYTVNFNDSITSICGRNGLGKTTIFDGFTWLLFGKDSSDRKTFELKTLDSNGQPIQKLPHEVSAILTVDGETVELTRRFNEKWVKRRGQAEEEFKGHEEERLFNNVPLSLKEWNEKIANICEEQVFKFITNPAYFVAQKTDAQRAMLFRMAGEVSDEEIAENNEDFKSLLAKLTGKTMEEYKKEIAAAKKRVKNEIDTIPDRIDEQQRTLAQLSSYDFAQLENEKTELQSKLNSIEEQLLDTSKQTAAAMREREALVKKLGEVKELRQLRIFAVKQEVLREYNQQLSLKINHEEGKKSLERSIKFAKEQIQMCDRKLEECAATREKLLAEYKSIKAEQLQFNENDFVCPTCHRPLDVADIEAKQQEMQENFNASKSARLNENVQKGKTVAQSKEAWEKTRSEYQTQLDNGKQHLEAVTKTLAEYGEMTEPNAQPAIDADEDVQKLNRKVERIEAQLAEEPKRIDNTELLAQKSSVQQRISEIQTALSNKSVIERSNKRIAELETQLRDGSQQLAELERTEFTIAAFNKARVESIENRINSLFSLVRFKMFAQQINGGEVETCEATANGIPYSGQNNAMRINMGIDIINAICKFEGITAPIFIDNAESVNSLFDTQSQLIRLVVTEDKELIIK